MLSSLLPIIYQYSQIKAQLRIEDQKKPLHEKDDDKHELYGTREDYQSSLTSFKEKFFSQFKNLIDPQNRLNEEKIKNLIEELENLIEQYFKAQFLNEVKEQEKKKAQETEEEYFETHRTPTDEEGNVLAIPTAYHSGLNDET